MHNWIAFVYINENKNPVFWDPNSILLTDVVNVYISEKYCSIIGYNKLIEEWFKFKDDQRYVE